ncbi:hypothetical protein LTS17_001487 [Exophiala oligosperma]
MAVQQSSQLSNRPSNERPDRTARRRPYPEVMTDEEREARLNMYLYFYPGNHNRITSRFLLNPPRHLLDDHHVFPVERIEDGEGLVEEDLSCLDRYPSTPDGFTIFFVRGTRRPTRVTYSPTLTWLIWGISDSCTMSPCLAYYYFAKWAMIDGWNSQEFRHEFDGLQEGVEEILEYEQRRGDALKMFTRKLLLYSFRVLDLDICGRRVTGKIIHWGQGPDHESLPQVVVFQASDVRRSLYALTKTRFQPDEVEELFPVAHLVGTDLSWEYAEDIGTAADRALRLSMENYINLDDPTGAPGGIRSGGGGEDCRLDAATATRVVEDVGNDCLNPKHPHNLDLSLGDNPALLAAAAAAAAEDDVVIDYGDPPSENDIFGSSKDSYSDSGYEFRSSDFLIEVDTTGLLP